MTKYNQYGGYNNLDIVIQLYHGYFVTSDSDTSYSLPKTLPDTQSDFYMPLITTAYSIIQIFNKNIGKYDNIYKQNKAIYKIFNINDIGQCHYIYCVFVFLIIQYLLKSNNIQKLID
jgi:hypothetical protein